MSKGYLALGPEVPRPPHPCTWKYRAPLSCRCPPPHQVHPSPGSLHCTYSREWFQNTQTGLLRSSVSSRVNSSSTGRSREPARRAPSLCTSVLTTGVLMTGRLGSLGQRSAVRLSWLRAGHQPGHGLRLGAQLALSLLGQSWLQKLNIQRRQAWEDLIISPGHTESGTQCRCVRHHRNDIAPVTLSLGWPQ